MADFRRCWLAPKYSQQWGEWVIRCYRLTGCRLSRYSLGDAFESTESDALATFNALMDAESKRMGDK